MRSQKNGKKVLILGGGGFIGGHLSKKLFDEGNFVRVVDIKEHEYFNENEYCNQFVSGDLRDPILVESVLRLETINGHPVDYSLLKQPFTDIESFDEVYQLPDMRMTLHNLDYLHPFDYVLDTYKLKMNKIIF